MSGSPGAIIRNILRDELPFSTWMLLGALSQAAIMSFCSAKLGLAIVVGLAAYRLTTLVIRCITFRPPAHTSILNQRHSAFVPDFDRSTQSDSAIASSTVVVFVVGFISTHPLGRFAPGMYEFTHHVLNIWNEAQSDRLRWGFLGKTDPLLSTSAQHGANAMIVISYWKSPTHLAEFGKAPMHAASRQWFGKNSEVYPHIGIMHETYESPAGCWENIYKQFPSFGFAQTVFPTPDGSSTVGPIMKTRGEGMQDMLHRMAMSGGKIGSAKATRVVE